MQIPKRKPGEFTHREIDYNITAKKLDELKKELETIKKIKLPRERDEVKHHAENGDFSENAAYQIAKGRLRRYLYRASEIESFLKKAVIIQPNPQSNTVQLGSNVDVNIDDKHLTFLILGALETDPGNNIISHKSKLGEALLHKKVGDIAEIHIDDKILHYKIQKIY